MCNGPTNGKRQVTYKVLVNIPSETFFLKFVYSSDVIKDAKLIFELFYSIVEETMDDNVVQIVTNGASCLHIQLYLDLILKDNG